MTANNSQKKPFYASLWVQVLLGVGVAIVLGYLSPARAVAMKPLGDAFIRLITMIISLVIFCTVVSGIAGMQDMRKVGRVGGKALLYFEVVSTLALLIGMVVGNMVQTGKGFNVNPAALDAKSVAALLDVPTDWKFIGYFCLGYPQADDTIPELEQSGWERRRLPSSVILRR